MDNLPSLIRQLKKGAAYFNQAMASGPASPWLRRQMAEYERVVMNQLDLQASRLTKEDRAIAEYEAGK